MIALYFPKPNVLKILRALDVVAYVCTLMKILPSRTILNRSTDVLVKGAGLGGHIVVSSEVEVGEAKGTACRWSPGNHQRTSSIEALTGFK